MRLLEAARRLSSRVAPRSRNRTAALFDTLADDISTWMQDRRQDPEGAQAILDETCRAIARYLKEHEESGAADE